jgi:CubicO group peptidase (beta-lactamase class C family)
MKDISERLRQILIETVDNKKVFGTEFAIKCNGETWQDVAGNFVLNQPYFIASTTKLFTTSLLLKLVEQKKLSLNDSIGLHLDSNILKGLHIYKGKEYSNIITIKQLMAHTTGLPDYFQGKNKEGNSLEIELSSGIDQSWNFEDVIRISKSMEPHFVPNTKGKALYSDTNFQLLGRMIENKTGKSFAENCFENIISPLSLEKTYVYTDSNDQNPKLLYFKNKELHVPKAMASFGCDGGMVSTSSDMIVFLEAFFQGKLFPKIFIEDLKQWNKIFFPMQSGVGIHLFRLPWIFNPFRSVPDLIGHSGLSGALAFYSPKHNLFICGTVNQVAYPDQSFKTAIKLINEVLKK